MVVVSNELNRARVKASREALIARIGIDEYRRQESAKRKNRRLRASARSAPAIIPDPAPVPTPNLRLAPMPFIPTIVQLEKTVPVIVQTDVGVDRCEKLVDHIFKEKEKYYSTVNPRRTIKRSTVVQQFNKVSNIYKNMFKVSIDCSDLSFLKDTTKVVGFVNGHFKSPNSRVSNISAIASILQVLPDYKAEYGVYSRLVSDLQREIMKKEEENTTTQKESKNILSWDKLKDLTKKEGLSVEDRALIGLYTLIPPRRIEEIQFLTITDTEVNTQPNVPLGSDLNYLVVKPNVPLGGIPTKLIFNRYKTASTYGIQEFEIAEDLADVLKPHIKGKKTGDPVFPSKTGGYIRNFSEYLAKILKRHTGKSISVNLLRHAFVTDYLDSDLSIASKKEMSNRMAHSITTQGFYNRVDL